MANDKALIETIVKHNVKPEALELYLAVYDLPEFPDTVKCMELLNCCATSVTRYKKQLMKARLLINGEIEK